MDDVLLAERRLAGRLAIMGERTVTVLPEPNFATIDPGQVKNPVMVSPCWFALPRSVLIHSSSLV